MPEIEATPERLAQAGGTNHYGVVQATIERAGDKRLLCRRFADSWVDRQRGNGRFTHAQWNAAEWYRERFEEAGLTSRVVANYSASVGGGKASYGMPTSERQARARQAWRAGRAALPQHMLAEVDRAVLHDVIPTFYGGRQRERFTARIADALQPLADWLDPSHGA